MKIQMKDITKLSITLLVLISLGYIFINNNIIDTGVKIKPEIQVIYNFVNNVNDKKYYNALENLTPHLAGGFSMDNNAPLRNIEHMEIKKLQDKTDMWLPNDNFDLNEFYDYRIFYAEIDYKINDIIYSFLKNGIYYHKIVTVKINKDSPWVIAEMSGAKQVQS